MSIGGGGNDPLVAVTEKGLRLYITLVLIKDRSEKMLYS
jgi:hypothetical protein